MYSADPLTTLLAACVAVLMVHAGLGKRLLVWKVAAKRRRRRRRPADWQVR
jgi:hypothetical protein